MEISVDGQVKSTQDVVIVPTPSISLNTPPKQTALVAIAVSIIIL